MCPFHFDIALPSGEAYRAVAGAASGRDAETALLRTASAFEANEIAEFTATLNETWLAGKSPIQMTVFMGKSSMNGGFPTAILKGSTVRLTREAADRELLFGGPNGTRRIV